MDRDLSILETRVRELRTILHNSNNAAETYRLAAEIAVLEQQLLNA